VSTVRPAYCRRTEEELGLTSSFKTGAIGSQIRSKLSCQDGQPSLHRRHLRDLLLVHPTLQRVLRSRKLTEETNTARTRFVKTVDPLHAKVQ
jgi:hypothetical protein